MADSSRDIAQPQQSEHGSDPSAQTVSADPAQAQVDTVSGQEQLQAEHQEGAMPTKNGNIDAAGKQQRLVLGGAYSSVADRGFQ